MTARNVQLKVMGNLALDVKHGYRTSMSKTSHANTTVAVVCNPTSNKGKGAQVGGHVIDLLRGAGRKHGFDVIDVTGTSFDDSLANARRRGDEYDYLVAVGGDGMVALGANAVGCSGKPLGIVVVASPQELVSMIVAKAVNMAEMMKVPMLGIVENMSYIVCPDCGKHINVFGNSHVDEVAAKHGLPVLAKCPIDPQLAALSDAGMIETYGGEYLEGAADACEKLLKK